MKREVDSALNVPEQQRKLIVLNESIGRQTFSSLSLKGNYQKIASKVPPEINPEDEELSSTRTAHNPKPSAGLQRRRILVMDNSQEEEIIAIGQFDKKNIIF